MNGQKTTLQMKDNTDHEFDSWRTSSQSHYSHSSALQTNQSSDPYAMSYYPTAAMFPYSESMPSSQPWSNGAETVAFLGQYADAGAHQPSQGMPRDSDGQTSDMTSLSLSFRSLHDGSDVRIADFVPLLKHGVFDAVDAIQRLL
jgi:hypothetical protein